MRRLRVEEDVAAHEPAEIAAGVDEGHADRALPGRCQVVAHPGAGADQAGVDADGDEDMKSPRSERGSANGSHRSRKRSRSRDSERRRARRDRYGDDSRSGGDYYRGGGRARTRSRSPYDDRYYRPSGRSRRDERDDDRRSRRERDTRRRSPTKSRERTPELNEEERDRRTIFVQQLAARLRTKELIAFFEKVGPVKEAQIVKDRVSGRSKG